MSHRCPTCKQAIQNPDELLIDVAAGVVQWNGRRAVLKRGNQMRILAALHGVYPGAMHKSRIIDAMYGDDPDGGPDRADDCLRTTIAHMRLPLRTIGVRVLTDWAYGYRLEFEPLVDMEKAA
jgi:hypothetical protein